MKRLLLAVLCCAASTGFVHAADDLSSNWQNGDLINPPARTITDDSNVNKTAAIIGAGSRYGSVSNASMTVDNKNISIDEATATAIYSSYTYKQGDFVAGGAVFENTVSNSTLTLNNMDLTGRSAYGGAALYNQRDVKSYLNSGSAIGNVVNVSNSKLNLLSFTAGTTTGIAGGNVFGGMSHYATSYVNNNTVTIDASTIEGSVFGAYIYDHITLEDLKENPGIVNTHADGNAVVVKAGSTIEGTLAGAAGASSSIGNTVVVDDSTVNDVYGVAPGRGVADNGVSVVHVDNNAVTIKNSTVNGTVAAVFTDSINASGNSLTLDQSKLTATPQLYAVNMMLGIDVDGKPVAATVGNNTFNLLNMTGSTFTELGASLSLAGTANGNTFTATKSDITLNNATGLFFHDNLNVANLEAHELLVDMPADKGIIFGGAGMTYTSQTGDVEGGTPPEKTVAINGTNSDNNTIILSEGTIDANVMGGFAAYIKEVNYTTTQKDDQDRVTSVVAVNKVGLVTTTTTTTTTYDKDTGAATTTTGDPVTNTADKIDAVYSASNNTIVLDNVTYDGKLYGGYVYGAELKDKNMKTENNTVILRNKVELAPTAEIYGGSNSSNPETNKLKFDRTIGTFGSKSQFQNFADYWDINANFDTDIDFNFNEVDAYVSLDPSAMKEGTQTIVSALTTNDLTNVQEGERLVNLTDNNVQLTQNRLGVYSYDLSAVKAGTNGVDWILTSRKDKQNTEMYGQLPLVGLALISEGPEMLNQTMNDVWNSDTDQNTFVNGGYHHTRYETGSGFDLDSGIMQAGAWKKLTNDWVVGLFGKYASGSYETYPIKVDGEASAFGGGLMTSWRYSDTGRVEARAEVGYMDMEFNSAELVSTFKSRGLYYGASAGFVENPFADLNLFANLQWINKTKDDASDNLGQTVEYDAMQSKTLRFGLDYTFNSINLGGLVPALGASGIYEMDGESSVTVAGMKNSNASLKGMSGRGQLSLVYHNQDTFLPMHTVLTVYGQAGKREGFGGEVNISFEF